jgi:hypothetical protein
VKRNINKNPIVIDSDDILTNPEQMLKLLCEKLGIRFDNQMLRWKKGPRETDGVWGKY